MGPTVRGLAGAQETDLNDRPPSESFAHSISMDTNNGKKKEMGNGDSPYLSCWGGKDSTHAWEDSSGTSVALRRSPLHKVREPGHC